VKPLLNKIIYYACFFDDDGIYIGKKLINIETRSFTYKERSFLFNSKNEFYLSINRFLYNYRYYFYNINNPDLLRISKPINSSVLSSEELEIFINTKKLKELNNLAEESGLVAMLKKLLTPLNIIIVVVIIGLIYYLSKHNWKLW
jgi:hypothetical protein